jgi:SOS-response transcriptional repressor LexA
LHAHQTPSERLKAARIRAGYGSAKAAAEAMGTPASTYVQHESGVRGFPVERATRYSRFFRTAPEWLLYGRGVADPVIVAPTHSVLPLLGQIRAGAWLQVDGLAWDAPNQIPAVVDPRFPHARQWLREVIDDSMNARGISNGDLAHMVDWPETELALKTGQIVEVSCFRDAGGLCEVTLKEVEVQGEKCTLWPRSDNQRWQEPIMMDGAGEVGVNVRVTGLLLATTRRF